MVWGHPLPEDVRDAARDAIRDLVRDHLTACLDALRRDLRDLGVNPEPRYGRLRSRHNQAQSRARPNGGTRDHPSKLESCQDDLAQMASTHPHEHQMPSLTQRRLP